MGLTYINVTIANPSNPKRFKRRRLLADSGALYSIIPQEALRAIGIRPYGTETFTLADGSTITRQVGSAFLRVNSRRAPTPVIFGEKGDGSLLGVIALESLGLTIDPRTGKLRPTPLFLMYGLRHQVSGLKSGLSMAKAQTPIYKIHLALLENSDVTPFLVQPAEVAGERPFKVTLCHAPGKLEIGVRLPVRIAPVKFVW